jgi:hypothetical protein
MPSLEKQATVFIFYFTQRCDSSINAVILDLLFSPGTKGNALTLTIQIEKQ